MRWLVLAAIILVCGCLEAEKEIQREYVCPGGQTVPSPDLCPKQAEPAATTTSTAAQQASSTTTQTTSTSTSTTLPPGPCDGLTTYKRQTCIALQANDATLCPQPGLERLGDYVTDSLFATLGEDLVGEGRKDLAAEVFAEGRTCVMALVGGLTSKAQCDAFPYPKLCGERFIVDADDAGLCEDLPQGPIQHGCYYALIRLRNNTQACFKYPDYMDCLAEQAASDPAVCRRAYLPQRREDLIPPCIAEAKLNACLRQTGQEDCCWPLQDDKKEECYAAWTARSNDTVWCDRVIAWGRFESDLSCYQKIAERTANASVCDLIPTIDSRDYCLSVTVPETGNQTLCEKIRSRHTRNKCVRETAQETI
jgi:hypothetical protein